MLFDFIKKHLPSPTKTGAKDTKSAEISHMKFISGSQESSMPRLMRAIPVVIAIVGIIFLALWLIDRPEMELTERIPGTDNVIGDEPTLQVTGDVFSGKLVMSDGVPANLPGAWPQFRGEDFDAVSKEKVTLARRWDEGEPKVLWGIDVGEGYAGAAVLNGRVYVLDYDAKAQEDALRCLSLADGREIWRYSYPVSIKRNHGMSRTIPAVTEKYVVSIGPMCHVLCVDAVTGEFLWAFDLVKEFKTVVPEWYAGQCPLIDGDLAILSPGGDALMIAVDCATGEIVWKTPNPNDWKMTHVSIAPMEFAGRRMYVYCGSGGVVGVSADDGSILWETTDWRISIATVPSPVIIGDGRIFFSGGYNSGSMMMRLKEENGKLVPETLYKLPPKVFGSDQQTPILFKDHIYGVRPDKQLVCIDLDGNPVWNSGPINRFGIGPYMIADNMIYVLDNAGLLTLANANTSGYNQLAQAQVLHGHDAWGPMALVGGRLIVRDLTRMICLDVTGK